MFHFCSMFTYTNLSNFNEFIESRDITYPCKCEASRCSCCSGNILQNFNFNFRQRLCTNISYDADDFEFNVRILFNDYTLFNRVVSGIIYCCFLSQNVIKYILLYNYIKLRWRLPSTPFKHLLPSLCRLQDTYHSHYTSLLHLSCPHTIFVVVCASSLVN